MALRMGELTELVTFQREVSTPDGMGGHEKKFADICTVWARVRPMSGREREVAHAVQSSASYVIFIHYRDDIRENDICIWQGRRMNIRWVPDRGPVSSFLEVHAEAGVGI